MRIRDAAHRAKCRKRLGAIWMGTVQKPLTFTSCLSSTPEGLNRFCTPPRLRCESRARLLREEQTQAQGQEYDDDHRDKAPEHDLGFLRMGLDM